MLKNMVLPRLIGIRLANISGEKLAIVFVSQPVMLTQFPNRILKRVKLKMF